MKRDMDLIREILLALEQEPDPMGPEDFILEGEDSDVVSFHVMLLDEANLIDALDQTSSAGFKWIPRRITWDGYEFLEASREPGRWEKAKALVKEKTGSLSFDVIKGVLLRAMSEAIF